MEDDARRRERPERRGRRAAALVAGLLLAELAVRGLALPALAAPGPAADSPATATAAPGRVPGARTEAPPETPRVVRAARVVSEPPTIDGRLGDAAWREAEVATDFVQLEPHPGEPASLRTEVRVLYSDEAVYVGARMHDPAPDSILARLARRDDLAGSDFFAVAFDSYLDRRTAFGFFVNAAGVRSDIRLSDDTREDPEWDAVWETAVRVDSAGWSAELRIPLSQLRFSTEDATEASPEDDGAVSGGDAWGINFERHIARHQESAFWSPLPADRSRVVSAFGTLRGLSDLEPTRRLEVRPYTVVRADRAPVAAENPLRDHTALEASAGGNLTVGITPGITLNAAVNPDFGQVEADPSVVNLSAFETFFPEKRPFFQEGAEIFAFDIGLGDGSNEQLFYSRRVGRSPRGGAPGEALYASVPEASTILGAAKLSGKTSNGWSVGFLDAVTAEERVRFVSADGEAGSAPVEPRTNYAVARVIRDFHDGNSALGAIFTATNRGVAAGDRLDVLPAASYAGGFDLRHRFGPGDDLELRAWALGSHVRGPAAAVDRLQRSSARYFQRPDADHVRYDPERTSLTGASASVELLKLGGGHWSYGGTVNARSPGFEVNDLGFQRNADMAVAAAFAGYRQFSPQGIFRRWRVNANTYHGWTFGGEQVLSGFNVNTSFQLTNHWRAYAGVERSLESLSTTELRGGPALLRPAQLNGWFGLNSDSRKSVRLSLNGNYNFEDETATRRIRLAPRLTVQPSSRMELSLGPRVTWNRDVAQYVTAVDAGGETRRVFGELEQTTAAVVARLNYTFDPGLSVEVYAQPFVSAGSYSGFKEVRDPRAPDDADRFRALEPGTLSHDPDAGRYAVDEDGDGSAEYTFGDPDFNVREFRSTAVLRWEYRPGSTLFLVWSQDRSGFGPTGDFRLAQDAEALFDVHPRNVLLVKLEHWLGL